MKNKKLILDYSKWICAEGSCHQVGNGHVALLNNEGYMCCLGQWALQLGASKEMLLNNGEPSECNTLLPGLNIERGDDEGYRNERFSDQAIAINDDSDTDAETKIDQLSFLCRNNGFELEVINRPPTT